MTALGAQLTGIALLHGFLFWALRKLGVIERPR